MTCDTGRPYPDPDPQRPQGHDACHKSHIGAHAPHAGADPMAESVLRALYPHSGMRRALLKSLGAQGLLAVVASLFPYRAAEAMLWDRTAPEHKHVRIAYLPIMCATPLIMAHAHGGFAREGLAVTLEKTTSWAIVRDRLAAGRLQVAHLLAPMPLTMSMGVGSPRVGVDCAALQNINGQAITLHLRHRNRRDPRTWKGMRFAIPFDYSIHNLLLRYYIAHYGLDPSRDVTLRVMPPPDMVANLRAGNIDGFLGPEPFNQRAVYDGFGYIHTLSLDIWDGHPCCSLSVRSDLVREAPGTFAAVTRALIAAAEFAHPAANRPGMVATLASSRYLNQPATVVNQVLTGRFADGLGHVRDVPDRIDFAPYPYPAMAVWILSQLKRWGYVHRHLRYQDIARQVYLAADAARMLRAQGYAQPASQAPDFRIMGRTFDPARPRAYLASLADGRR